jgi:glycosyltransferase involved in cell wall biosynthesis
VKEKVKNKLKLIFIGNGPDRPRLEGIVRRNSLENDVLFHGFVNRGDRVLKVFDIFVLPTSFEGCSNVLVEAMAKGIPIVTTNIPSVNWMFENRRDVLLFRKNDVDDLSEKILEVVNNKSLRNNLAENVLIKFQKDFDAQIMIDRIDEIYQSLLS